jgi:hypothetical protein
MRRGMDLKIALILVGWHWHCLDLDSDSQHKLTCGGFTQ